MQHESVIEIGLENTKLRNSLRDLARAVKNVDEFERGLGRRRPLNNSFIYRDRDEALKTAIGLLKAMGEHANV